MADMVAGLPNGDESVVFGDIDAKMRRAVGDEVERRLSLGLPVMVDEGRGVEDLGFPVADVVPASEDQRAK